MLLLRPVQAVHVGELNASWSLAERAESISDQSPYGAMKRTKKLLGNDASDLQDKRIRIIKSVPLPFATIRAELMFVASGALFDIQWRITLSRSATEGLFLARNSSKLIMYGNTS